MPYKRTLGSISAMVLTLTLALLPKLKSFLGIGKTDETCGIERHFVAYLGYCTTSVNCCA
jgi:hypothetical protein